MKTLILIVAFISTAFIESSFYSLPLTLYLVIFLYVFEVRYSNIWSFIAGILVDLISFRLLGSSSLLFLIGFLLWQRISQKVQTNSFLYQLFFLVIMVGLYDLVLYKGFFLQTFIRNELVGSVLLFCMGKIIPPVKKTTKLRV